MADILTLNQCIHGYMDGHRLLASSVSLKPKEARSILVLSDISGSNTLIGENGYLTGYPLADSNYYAIARTWSAKEISRPGCVWTHTVLVSKQELESMVSLEFLVQLHRYPTSTKSFVDYERPLTFASEDFPPEKSTPDELELAKKLTYALYSNPISSIVVQETKCAERTVLGLWTQQWPSLRFSFRFCTLASADRSSDGAIFDLQFVPNREKKTGGRFNSKVIDADKIQMKSPSWLSSAMTDYQAGSDGKLRQFFRELVVDFPAGREAFIPLCKLFALLNQTPNTAVAIDKMIDVAEKTPDPSLQRVMKSVAVNGIAECVQVVTDKAVSFLLQNLDLLSDPASAGRALFNRSPNLIINLLDEDGYNRTFATETMNCFSLEKILSGVETCPSKIPSLIEVMPKLLYSVNLWKIKGYGWEAGAIKTFSETLDSTDEIVRTILLAGRTDLSSEVLNAFGTLSILNVLDELFEDEQQSSVSEFDFWFRESVREANEITELLNRTDRNNRTILFRFAQQIEPDSIRDNNSTIDPWVTAVHQRRGYLNSYQQEFLFAFLLTRAFGFESQSAALLIAIGLDTIYDSASQSTLSLDAWSMLSQRLPQPSWWQEWDRCDRLRVGVAHLFLQRQLPVSVFCEITSNLNLFADLCQIIVNQGRVGRNYLAGVKAELRSRSDSESRERLRILKRRL